VRRPHPLQGDGGLVEGIAREREVLAEIRARADLVLDTSLLNVYELRERVGTAFDAVSSAAPLQLTLMSFGYKYGLPVDADLVVDCRFLPNPHWIPELRPHTGQEDPVRDYVLSREGAAEFVMAQPGAEEFLERASDLLATMTEGYVREGRRYVTVAVGCTGGKHRSVATAEALSTRLARTDRVDTFVVHRDLGRE
jgi:UPF0042 nucleotide-binding protein